MYLPITPSERRESHRSVKGGERREKGGRIEGGEEWKREGQEETEEERREGRWWRGRRRWKRVKKVRCRCEGKQKELKKREV